MYVNILHNQSKSLTLHPLKQTNGPVAQLYRAFDYGSEGYRLESCRGHLLVNHLRFYVSGFLVILPHRSSDDPG